MKRSSQILDCHILPPNCVTLKMCLILFRQTLNVIRRQSCCQSDREHFQLICAHFCRCDKSSEGSRSSFITINIVTLTSVTHYYRHTSTSCGWRLNSSRLSFKLICYWLVAPLSCHSSPDFTIFCAFAHKRCRSKATCGDC